MVSIALLRLPPVHAGGSTCAATDTGRSSPLSLSRITTSLGFTSCCIASQQASIDELPHPIRSGEFTGIDDDASRPLRGGAAQLQSQFESKMICRNHIECPKPGLARSRFPLTKLP